MRVLIVDDDRLVSSSLKTILEADGDIEVVGTGSSGSQAIELYGECRPDILLMDIRMDGMTGIEVAEILLKRDPDAKILFLTTFSDDDYIIKALRIGAKGYLLKQNFESIVPSIKTVAIGQRVFGDEIITRIPAMLSSGTRDDFKEFGLSEKETEIITQVANGLSNKEIAETLFLSEGTVRNYISVILEKLELRDRTQLAIFYYKHS
ncbi:response regulator [Caproiciproducens sp.]